MVFNKQLAAHVQKVIRDAYWKHLSSSFTFEGTDPDSPKNETRGPWATILSPDKYSYCISANAM